MNLLESLLPSDFRRAVDAPLRRFFLAIFVSCFAMGLTLSLYVVYLHNVLGFSIGFSTLLLAGSSLAGLFTSPLWGTLTDRVGPAKVLLLASVTDALALAYWSYVHSSTSAVIGALLLAVLGGATWGPASTLLVRLVSPEHRQRAYGFDFMLVNLGMGAGGLVSASVVDLHHPLSFRWLYVGNAVVSLIAGILFASLWRYDTLEERSIRAAGEATRGDGWLVVWKDRRLVLFVVASLVIMLGGYPAVDAGLSLFVVNDLHMSVHVIGVFLFVNALTIVLAQLVVVNVIEARSRTRVLAVVAVLWFVFWAVLGLAESFSTALRVAAISLAMVVFALGETLMSPLGPAIVNDMAPEHLRGRYNATQSLVWGVSATLAPAIAAAFFDNGLSQWWPLGVGCATLVGGALMLNLRRHLSAAEDGVATN